MRERHPRRTVVVQVSQEAIGGLRGCVGGEILQKGISEVSRALGGSNNKFPGKTEVKFKGSDEVYPADSTNRIIVINDWGEGVEPDMEHGNIKIDSDDFDSVN